VGGGADTTGGNIFIDPEYVILQRSRIIANAYEGKGGNITIISDCFMADPDSIVEASSALGIDGVVDIQAPINNVSGSITGLPKDFKSAVELLRQACAARAKGGSYSSFIMGGRGGLPIEPGGLIPSPVF
jgi:large exoprotein involved in heme utilization and adhesion